MCKCNCDPCWICGIRPKSLTLSGGAGCCAVVNGPYAVEAYGVGTPQPLRPADLSSWHRPYGVSIPDTDADARCKAEWWPELTDTFLWTWSNPFGSADFRYPLVAVCASSESEQYSVTLANWIATLAVGIQDLALGGASQWAAEPGARRLLLRLQTAWQMDWFSSTPQSVFAQRVETHWIEMPDNCRGISAKTVALDQVEVVPGAFPATHPTTGVPVPPALLAQAPDCATNPDPRFSAAVEF